ncbi:MAG: DUF2993 domain-containing protein [Chloroherpetonaceae bacterium]|nr:DUF2993 domain-containing protein [Chthonomonadaceae bacterium]MDW8207636.1 DUF2993 domain-containing protein [Chloroherpetonaceae bacterium]
MSEADVPFSLELGPTEVVSRQVHLPHGVVLEQVQLHAEAARYIPETRSSAARVVIDELHVKAVISEPHLNAMVGAHLRSEVLRGINVAILSGKLRVTGQFVKWIPVPFTLEVTPHIENGIRIRPEFLGLSAAAFALPSSAVELLEQHLRPLLTVDLTQLPVPVYVDRLVCEPGRLVLQGRARLHWPPLPVSSPRPSLLAPPNAGESGVRAPQQETEK